MNARLCISMILTTAFLVAASQTYAQRGARCQAAMRFDTEVTGATIELDDDLRESVLHMREEEKLARDVYLTLSKKHNLPVFARIAAAETRHMEAMKGLVVRHGLEDPVVDETLGKFHSSKFTQLYSDLVTAGSESRAAAYQVGALIEELDIADLNAGDKYLAEHRDVAWVYQNLNRGSRNHLRIFAAQLEAVGESYEAKHLSQQEFDAIASSPIERGNGRRRMNGKRSMR